MNNIITMLPIVIAIQTIFNVVSVCLLLKNAKDAANGDLKIETTVSPSKSLSREERIHQLQSERGHLLRIISLIPADEVLNKRSLEYRLKQVEADLESLLGEESLLKAQEEK